MTQDKINRLFDSAVFNRIVLGYVAKSCDDLGYTASEKKDLLNVLKYQFDNNNAEYALDYWMNDYY